MPKNLEPFKLLAVRDIERCDSVGLQRDWLFRLFAQ
jgi:hypothetical protein